MENKSKILEKSVSENLKKYGFDYTVAALNDLINHNHYKGFTRENNARKQLIENINNKDIISIILKNLNIYLSDNFILSSKDINMLCKRYIKLVNKLSFD